MRRGLTTVAACRIPSAPGGPHPGGAAEAGTRTEGIEGLFALVSRTGVICPPSRPVAASSLPALFPAPGRPPTRAGGRVVCGWCVACATRLDGRLHRFGGTGPRTVGDALSARDSTAGTGRPSEQTPRGGGFARGIAKTCGNRGLLAGGTGRRRLTGSTGHDTVTLDNSDIVGVVCIGRGKG